jgi:hypothetical protein
MDTWPSGMSSYCDGMGSWWGWINTWCGGMSSWRDGIGIWCGGMATWGNGMGSWLGCTTDKPIPENVMAATAKFFKEDKLLILQGSHN